MSFLNELVGAMPPDEFLARFMTPREGLPPAPHSKFAQICSAKSDKGAQRAFVSGAHDLSLYSARLGALPQIRAVEASRICPHLRFYIPKLKQRSIQVLEDEMEDQEEYGLCFETPHLSVAGCKKTGKLGKRSRKDYSQLHDFAASVLEVDIALDKTQDPFEDPDEDLLVRLCLLRTFKFILTHDLIRI